MLWNQINQLFCKWEVVPKQKKPKIFFKDWGLVD